MTSPNPSVLAKDLILWAVQEVLELDELCRGQIPGYGPLDSSDMERLAALRTLASTFNAKAASKVVKP